MPLRDHISDRELDKFGLTLANLTAVRVIMPDGSVVTGSIDSTPTGLTGRRTFVILVGDTPTLIGTGLTRESIQIINEGANPLRLGAVTVSFAGATRGMPVGVDEGWNEDTTETAPLYGICDAGKTTSITGMEYFK